MSIFSEIKKLTADTQYSSGVLGVSRGSSPNLSDCVFQDLEQRHNTILQMYGEKAEEAEELRLDLEDVKNMYKTQIDELLQNQK